MISQTDIDAIVRGGYAGKRVVVTGGCSFIGSHIVDALITAGAIVTVVDDLSSGRLANINWHIIAGRVSFIAGDLRDMTVCLDATEHQDICIQLAALHGGRGYIDTHPADICDNFVITTQVIKACHINSVDRVIIGSSACVYPIDAVGKPLNERMTIPAAPDGMYGWEKLTGEGILQAYHQQYGLKGVSCRIFTAYGPRALPSHAIIAMIMRSLIKQDPYIIWGTGLQTREFTYITDVVNGMLVAGLRITDGSAINIGSDDLNTIDDIATYINACTDHTPTYLHDLSKPMGVMARTADVTYQLDMLEFKPSTTYSYGITATIAWIRANYTIAAMQAIVEGKLNDR